MVQVAENLIAKPMSHYEFRCSVCGFLIRDKQIPGSSVPVANMKGFGTNVTPPPITFTDEMYAANTIAFAASSGSTPARLTDSVLLFRDKLFTEGMTIRVATNSGTNDGDYIIADRGVSRGEILLSDSDSLTTESAATAGRVTISKVSWKPNRTFGCPSCGNWASR
jgi:predicted RNA-binding Zn-ribbon protein involved in translation (DUF1610 family)